MGPPERAATTRIHRLPPFGRESINVSNSTLDKLSLCAFGTAEPGFPHPQSPTFPPRLSTNEDRRPFTYPRTGLLKLVCEG